MQLHTLNLHKPLRWLVSETSSIHSIDEAFTVAEKSPNGAELAMFWPWNDIIDESGDDGPHTRHPLPPPALIAGSGLNPEQEGTAAPAESGNEERLEAGRYLFVQTRLESVEALSEAIDAFCREVWWTKAAGEGDLTLRLVCEDSKTAAQLIRKLA